MVICFSGWYVLSHWGDINSLLTYSDPPAENHSGPPWKEKFYQYILILDDDSVFFRLRLSAFHIQDVFVSTQACQIYMCLVFEYIFLRQHLSNLTKHQGYLSIFRKKRFPWFLPVQLNQNLYSPRAGLNLGNLKHLWCFLNRKVSTLSACVFNLLVCLLLKQETDVFGLVFKFNCINCIYSIYLCSVGVTSNLVIFWSFALPPESSCGFMCSVIKCFIPELIVFLCLKYFQCPWCFSKIMTVYILDFSSVWSTMLKSFYEVNYTPATYPPVLLW